MSTFSRFCIILLITTVSACAQNSDIDTPNWLAGKPDLVELDERLELYEWILEEADQQTGNLASSDSLARSRLINLANKLTDHHQKSPESEYSLELKYLLLGDREPMHFNFIITAETLQHLLDEK